MAQPLRPLLSAPAPQTLSGHGPRRRVLHRRPLEPVREDIEAPVGVAGSSDRRAVRYRSDGVPVPTRA